MTDIAQPIADIEAAVPEARSGLVGTIPIYASDVINYGALARDFNPIHFDARSAQSIGLDGTIAHGMLVVARVEEYLRQRLDLSSITEMKWAFGDPMYVDMSDLDPRHLTIEVTRRSVSPVGEDGVTRAQFVIRIMDGMGATIVRALRISGVVADPGVASTPSEWDGRQS